MIHDVIEIEVVASRSKAKSFRDFENATHFVFTRKLKNLVLFYYQFGKELFIRLSV